MIYKQLKRSLKYLLKDLTHPLFPVRELALSDEDLLVTGLMYVCRLNFYFMELVLGLDSLFLQVV